MGLRGGRGTRGRPGSATGPCWGGYGWRGWEGGGGWERGTLVVAVALWATESLRHAPAGVVDGWREARAGVQTRCVVHGLRPTPPPAPFPSAPHGFGIRVEW